MPGRLKQPGRENAQNPGPSLRRERKIERDTHTEQKQNKAELAAGLTFAYCMWGGLGNSNLEVTNLNSGSATTSFFCVVSLDSA